MKHIGNSGFPLCHILLFVVYYHAERMEQAMKIGFDNDKYLKMQSERIIERIGHFDNKLYLEFGGKLFDDFHASRVLPGFAADSKLQMLMKLAHKAEIVMVVSAADIEKNKVRGDLGITYDNDVIRLIDEFQWFAAKQCKPYNMIRLTEFNDRINFFLSKRLTCVEIPGILIKTTLTVVCAAGYEQRGSDSGSVCDITPFDILSLIHISEPTRH